MSTDPGPLIALWLPALTLPVAYLIGSIPWAYIIVRTVTGEDVTGHGTGNVGAMNVRRTTGSWFWFTVAMAADASKGIVPVALAKLAISGVPLDAGLILRPWGEVLSAFRLEGIAWGAYSWATVPAMWVPLLAVAGAVIGHNYSAWMALIKRRFERTGKGLATGGGALLAYDWRYFLIVLAVGLLTIAFTKYMMAGQVAAAASLPLGALILRSPDWPFALAMGAFVYAAHHKRFVGLLKGQEPRLYINDRMGPRG